MFILKNQSLFLDTIDKLKHSSAYPGMATVYCACYGEKVSPKEALITQQWSNRAKN